MASSSTRCRSACRRGLLSNAVSYYFYRQWKNTEGQLALAMNVRQQLAQDYELAKQDLSSRDQDLAVLRNPDMVQVVLKPVPNAPAALAAVYWDPASKAVYLDAGRMPRPPAGQQYQLWALDQGKPVDAGVFNAGSEATGLQSMKAITSAQAFAVTLEPAGGRPEPTLEQLRVMGEVKKV